MRSLAFGAALAVAAAGEAAASPFDEVKFGVLSQGAGVISPDKEPGADVNVELLFKPIKSLAFIGSPRFHVGTSLATAELGNNGGTSAIYAGFTWEQHLFKRLFVDGSVGFAVHDGRTDFSPFDANIGTTQYLGCRALIRFSAEIGYEMTPHWRASLYASHMSNGGVCSENEGLDGAGFRIGYKL